MHPGFDEEAAPPPGLEAEQAVLGILLYEPDAASLISGLAGYQFFEPVHGLIFDTISGDIANGRSPDPITVHDRLKHVPAMGQLGGIRYLMDLADRAPPARSIGDYARLIGDSFAKRSLSTLLNEAAKALSMGAEVDEVTRHLSEGVGSVQNATSTDETWIVSAQEATEDVVDALQRERLEGKPRGVRCGLRCIDERLGGMKPGKQVVLGGRPSMGKTALARNIMWGAAKLNEETCDFGFFTVEMLKRELIERQLSQQSHLDSESGFNGSPAIKYEEIGNGFLSQEQINQLARYRQITPPNLIIKDHPVMTIDSIRRDAFTLKRRAEKRGRRLGGIAIDYLQLIQLPGEGSQNDAARWGIATKAIKQLANQLEIFVLLLSQLNRKVEERDDKRPQLADLRESGSIEQDADAVLFAYREHYYLSRAEPTEEKKRDAWLTRCANTEKRLDVIVPKNRGGAIGIDTQLYNPAFDHIENRHV